MSSADPEEVSVEIQREGISVEKSFEPDDFPVPAIAFVIRSDRDVPVDVTLVDTVPDDIQAEDIGFHPKYGAEHWRNEGKELIFGRTFESGEEYTTVYGLRARDTEDIARFLGEPELAEVDPPQDSSQVVRDVINEGDEGSVPGTSDDDLEAAIAAADVDSDPGSPPVGRPQSPESPESPGSTGTDETDETVAPQPSGEPVAATLAESIRTGQVSDDDLEVLRDALGDGESPSNSQEVRVDHLQSEVADLKAYSDALEEFIDENGEARTLIRDLQETVDGMRSDVTRIENEAEVAAEEAAEANGRVDELGDDVSRIDGEVDQVSSEFDDLEERVESVSEETDSVRAEVENVRDEIPEDRIDELDDRMDELQSELVELAEMRKRMASVFGGMGGADPTADADADTDGE